MELDLAISSLALFRNSYIVELLFCGATTLLSVCMGALFLRSREKLYFYYFLFLLFSLLAASINVWAYDWQTNYLDFSSNLMRKNLELVTLLGLFAYCLFSLDLLNVKEQDRRLHRWIIMLAVMTALYGFFYWVLYKYIKPHEQFFFIGSRIIILLMSLLAIIGVSYRTHSAFKSYFIIGSIFYLAGALIGVLRETVSGLPFPYFYEYTASVYFYCGIFLEIICFALALNHRVYLIHQRQKRENENLKERALYERDLAMVRVLGSQSQNNPHFIFNQFSAIKYLIQQKKNSKAIKLLMTYSRFIRQVLDAGVKQEITLRKEFDILRQYLRLEAIRKGDNFSFNIRLDPVVNLEETWVPPIIIQPYIEQLIWRDFQIDEGVEKRLSVNIKKRGKEILIGVRLAALEERGGWSLKGIKRNKLKEFNNERLRIYNRSNPNAKINCYRRDYRASDSSLSAILIVFFIGNGEF